jgi:predicted enzyme related to lactoylglutathione lyase
VADPGASVEVVVGQGARLRIFARDPDRARAFYAQVFGWSLPDDGQRRCWVITSGDDPVPAENLIRPGQGQPWPCTSIFVCSRAQPAGADNVVRPGRG